MGNEREKSVKVRGPINSFIYEGFLHRLGFGEDCSDCDELQLSSELESLGVSEDNFVSRNLNKHPPMNLNGRKFYGCEFKRDGIYALGEDGNRFKLESEERPVFYKNKSSLNGKKDITDEKLSKFVRTLKDAVRYY
jgi:hypothetical protein